MPSNSPTTDANNLPVSGTLYVVATPIGNKDDITVRALAILGRVDLVAAEDTRKTGRFLARHNLSCRFISYHEHNEEQRTPVLLDKLKKGFSIALVSNAGTPCVADPGYRLIQAAINSQIEVIPIPGVSAAIAALSVAGLPTDAFVFAGFADRKKGKRLQLITELAAEQRTLIFYESPKRITGLLEEIIDAMGDRAGVLAREITKLHEEFVRGQLSEILACIRERPKIKGECTLLVAGRTSMEKMSWQAAKIGLEAALESKAEKISVVAKRFARKHGLPKNKVYEAALEISGRRSTPANQKGNGTQC